MNQTKEAQRDRLLAFLRAGGMIATSECRELLGVMHPAARIMELRRAGHEIKTTWRYVADGSSVVHRQGVYVLCEGVTP
ncbi:MAG: helix-turn-helix domain-containing protein [Zoogloeaceae bacterium]|nr:helix-turn-helix domain-containing protein [Zoogloeaceae bacterium]